MSIINVEGKGSLNSFIFEGAPKNFIFDGDIVVDQANIDINTNQLGKSNAKKKKSKIGIEYNAPISLTFSLICLGIFIFQHYFLKW